VITLDQTMRNAVEHLGVPLHTRWRWHRQRSARDAPRRPLRRALRHAADFILLDDAPR
jgi:hypothetical protein